MADVEVTYENTLIKSLSATGQAVLHTAGKYCDDDITIDYTSPGGGGSGIILDCLSVTEEVITIGANTVTNTAEFDTYIKSLMTTPSALYGFSQNAPVPLTYNNICSMIYRDNNLGQCYRYRSGSWSVIPYRNNTYDAVCIEGTTYTVLNRTLSHP